MRLEKIPMKHRRKYRLFPAAGPRLFLVIDVFWTITDSVVG